MAGWRHQLNGHEFEQAPGDGEGQGSLAFCSPWGREESDMTEQLNNNPLKDNFTKVKACVFCMCVSRSVVSDSLRSGGL